jgi:hypothetical protein
MYEDVSVFSTADSKTLGRGMGVGLIPPAAGSACYLRRCDFFGGKLLLTLCYNYGSFYGPRLVHLCASIQSSSNDHFGECTAKDVGVICDHRPLVASRDYLSLDPGAEYRVASGALGLSSPWQG